MVHLSMFLIQDTLHQAPPLTGTISKWFGYSRRPQLTDPFDKKIECSADLYDILMQTLPVFYLTP